MLVSILEIVLGIIGLSIVVLVHEAGHYFAARLSGIRVETFSIGFGRRIVGFRRGGTDYRLSLIPLGGYCRFYGEQSFRRALDENLDRIPGEPGEFHGSPAWRRIIVSLSGPLANIVFSIVVLTAISWIGYREQYTDPRVILVSEYSEDGEVWPSDIAGLESGDIIVEVDGRSIDRFQELRRRLILRPEERVELTVMRSGRRIALEISPRLDKENGRALIGVMNWIDPLVDAIQPGSSAERAGLRPGDRILAMSGVETPHTVAVYTQLESAEGAAVETLVGRDGGDVVLQWTAPPDTEPGAEFRIRTGRSVSIGFPESLLRGARETWSTLVSTLRGIRMMFMGIELRNAVSGPIRLISDTGATVAAGFRSGFGPGLLWSFELMALISVSLAFLNLLPIPVLDGGQIVLFAAECVRRRPLNPRSVYRYQFVGTIIVIAIAIAATAGDIVHLRGR